MLTKSIRWRFQLWLAFLLVSLLIGFGVTAHQLYRNTQLRQVDEQLQRRLSALSASLSGNGRDHDHPPGGFKPDRQSFGGHDRSDDDWEFEKFEHDWPDGSENRGQPHQHRDFPAIQLAPEIASLFNQADSNAFYFVVWNHEGSDRLRSTNAPAGLKVFDRVVVASGPQTRMRDVYRESFLQHIVGYQVLVGCSMAANNEALCHFTFGLVVVGLGVLAVGLGVGWWLTGRALRPVQDISNIAARISAGNLSERINIAKTHDELGRLAGTLNSTFARLESAFAQQRQFTSDASHELRTPITVLISEAQTTLARERSPEDYREAITACLDTAQKMRQLTESLLQLARMDAGQEMLHLEKINLADVVEECTKLIRPLAAARNLKIACDLAPAEVFGDATRIVQVVTNLLTNAINYNKDGGKILVATRVENRIAVLTVTDTGRGIAAKELPRVFERFYRADKSRTGGNTGLGLAISKAIIETHGGTIEVTSEENVGATFTVRIPV